MGRWSYRSYPNEHGERFAASQTWHIQDNSEDIINFWHITPEHTFLYTIKPNETYNREVEWTEALCHQLIGDLKVPKPATVVVRYVVDGQQLFSDVKGKKFPKPPEAPKPQAPANPEARAAREARKQLHLSRQQQPSDPDHLKARKRRAKIEARKCKEPAPFILYGKHDTGGNKEYAWQLTPDKPKRQGIVPGDRVLVWTKYGFDKVTVTRIEPAEGKEQPTARVKKKLLPGDPENEA